MYKEFQAGQEVTEVARERDVNFGTIRMLESFLVSGGKVEANQTTTIRRKSTKAQAVDFGPKLGSKTTDDIATRKQTVPIGQKFATLRV